MNLIEKIGLPATLELLAEECAELAQAALKMSRIVRGENPTPVKEGVAVVHLAEEIADVEIVAEHVKGWRGVSADTESWKEIKRNRLTERLSKLP